MNAVLSLLRRLHCKWELGIGKQQVEARVKLLELGNHPSGGEGYYSLTLASNIVPSLRSSPPYLRARCSTAQCDAHSSDALWLRGSHTPLRDWLHRPSYSRSQTTPAHLQTASTSAFVASGLKTIEKTPAEPVKSRFQNSCPGELSSAGCSTRSISGRAASQRAIRKRRGFDVLQAHGHGPHAAQGQAAIVGRRRAAQQLLRRS